LTRRTALQQSIHRTPAHRGRAAAHRAFVLNRDAVAQSASFVSIDLHVHKAVFGPLDGRPHRQSDAARAPPSGYGFAAVVKAAVAAPGRSRRRAARMGANSVTGSLSR